MLRPNPANLPWEVSRFVPVENQSQVGGITDTGLTGAPDGNHQAEILPRGYYVGIFSSRTKTRGKTA